MAITIVLSATIKKNRIHQLGHCDSIDNSAAMLFDQSSDKDLVNKHGTPIPSVNASAIFHNIFWMFTLDSTSETVSFKRINTGGVFGVIAELSGTLKRGDLSQLIDQLGALQHSNDPFNFPPNKKDFYTCSYHDGQNRSCTAQNP